MYINTASPTPQGLVQRFKANGIQCERVKNMHTLMYTYIYICIYIYTSAQEVKTRYHLYIYLNIHTQANSRTAGKVYECVYIYICVDKF